MVSLREMNDRRQEWINSKPAFGGGNKLWLDKGDLVLGWFVANGDEGDRFIKVYKAHIIPTKTKNGRDSSIASYCPIQTDDKSDIPCPNCQAGIHMEIKERMSMWFYIDSIMHSVMPQEKQFPIQPYEGKNYFYEEVKGFRVWHASAWKESPWTDIVKLAELYKGLHNFAMQMETIGDGVNRRYKVYAIPNSQGLDAALYAKAQEECESLTQMLVGEMTTPTVANPMEAASQAGSSITAPTSAFSLGVTPAQPSGLAASNTPSFSFGAPTTPAPQEAQEPTSSAETEATEDAHRPMKRMF